MPDRVAIIGTRRPDTIHAAAAFVCAAMLTSNYHIVVRTGAAEGVDERAMAGSLPSLLEVVLPWARFNRHLIPPGAAVTIASEELTPHWFASVDKLHPSAHRLSQAARRLHARNYGIVDGCILTVALPGEGGGTRQGIRVSNSLGIPVIQADMGTLLNKEQIIDRVEEFIKAHRAYSEYRVPARA